MPSPSRQGNYLLSGQQVQLILLVVTHHHYHLSLNHEGRWGTIDDFVPSFLHFLHCPMGLGELQALMLSSHLVLCPPCLLPPFTVPCQMVLARPDERETCSLQFVSLYCGQEVFVWSDYLLDLGTDFLVGDMVFV